MYLSTSTIKLQTILGGAVSANALQYTCEFVDVAKADNTRRNYLVGGSQRSVSNDTTDVDVVDATARTDITRVITRLDCYNADTASATLIIKKDDGGTETIQIRVVLATLESLHYRGTVDGGGKFYVTTANGSIKSDAGLRGPSSSTDSALALWDGTGGSVLKNSTVTLSSTVLAPTSNDGIALGTASLSFADLFIASGGVINFNNGNYTVTHSAGLLTLSNALTLTTGALTVSGVTGHAIGGAATARSALTLTGTKTLVTSLGSIVALDGGTLTAQANNDGMYWFTNAAENNNTFGKSTFTGLRASLVRLNGNGLVATGTGTIDNAILMDFGTLPTIGTNNAVFGFPADNTDPTGGGGAATGRVPVIIAGAVKYLAYY